MGGNLLAHWGLPPKRIDKTEFDRISCEIRDTLSRHSAAHIVSVVKSYRSKETFGDVDILLSIGASPSGAWFNTESIVRGEIGPQRLFTSNGDVYSFPFDGVQIDIINVAKHNHQMASDYFAYNDLGNLVGRLAHTLGCKYGSDGLGYKITERDWDPRSDSRNTVKEVCLLNDQKSIYGLLGLSYDRFLEGFDTLEDIFEFVVTSPHFYSDLYLLENATQKQRQRDDKRPTYLKFLDWLKINHPPQGTGLKPKEEFRWKLEAMPHFVDSIECAKIIEYNKAEIRLKFNGNIVTELLELEGAELGNFMRDFKRRYNDEWLLAAPARLVRHTILEFANEWDSTPLILKYFT